jgi:hypothetical protein
MPPTPTGPSREPRRSLAVVPPLAIRRYYGEAPARLRRCQRFVRELLPPRGKQRGARSCSASRCGLVAYTSTKCHLGQPIARFILWVGGRVRKLATISRVTQRAGGACSGAASSGFSVSPGVGDHDGARPLPDSSLQALLQQVATEDPPRLARIEIFHHVTGIGVEALQLEAR